MVERSPPIVLAWVTNFWSEVTTFDTRTNAPRLYIPNLHHERLHAIVLALDDKACEDDGVARKHSQITRPVFGRADSWGMDHKLVCGLIECGCGL